MPTGGKWNRMIKQTLNMVRIVCEGTRDRDRGRERKGESRENMKQQQQQRFNEQMTLAGSIGIATLRFVCDFAWEREHNFERVVRRFLLWYVPNVQISSDFSLFLFSLALSFVVLFSRTYAVQFDISTFVGCRFFFSFLRFGQPFMCVRVCARVHFSNIIFSISSFSSLFICLFVDSESSCRKIRNDNGHQCVTMNDCAGWLTYTR